MYVNVLHICRDIYSFSLVYAHASHRQKYLKHLQTQLMYLLETLLSQSFLHLCTFL